MSSANEIFWDGGNFVGLADEFYLNLRQRRLNAIEAFAEEYGFRPNEEEVVWKGDHSDQIKQVLGLQGY